MYGKVFDLRCEFPGSSGLLLVEEMSNTNYRMLIAQVPD